MLVAEEREVNHRREKGRPLTVDPSHLGVRLPAGAGPHAINVTIVAENTPADYSGGRYHSWLMAEALAAAGHRVRYATNNLPIFYNDFDAYPYHREIGVCLVSDLGQRRDALMRNGGRLEVTPWRQLAAVAAPRVSASEAAAAPRSPKRPGSVPRITWLRPAPDA